MTGILLEIFKKCIKISNENKILEEKGGIEMRIGIQIVNIHIDRQ